MTSLTLFYDIYFTETYLFSKALGSPVMKTNSLDLINLIIALFMR